MSDSRQWSAVGIIVARFQTPDLHEGHRFLIEEVCRRHRDVLIVLGVSPARPNNKNMFPFEIRKGMIEETYPDRTFTIVPSMALPADDLTRSKHFDEQVQTLFPGREARAYGSRDSFIHRYKGKIPTEEIETVYSGSATQIRNSIEIRHTSDFRHGYGRAIMDIGPHLYQAVDVVVWEKNRGSILLVGHAHEESWRFPGVLFDVQQDSDFENAAVRCIKKELPGVTTLTPEPVCSVRIADWRYKGTRDGILSMIMSAQCDNTDPGMGVSPGSGVNRAQWFAPWEIRNELLVREHQPIADILAKKGVISRRIQW